MKNLLIVLFIFTLEARAGVLKGTILPYVKGTEYLVTLINYDTRKDSIVNRFTTDETGYFFIEVENYEPLIYSLGTEKKVLLHLVIMPRDEIELTITDEKIVGKGSPDTQYLQDYEAFRISVFKEWLKPVYDSASAAEKRGDKERLEYWNKKQTSASNAYKSELSKWVNQPFFLQSPAAIHHSLRWHPDNDIALMDNMLANFKKNYPSSTLTKQLQAKVARTKRTALGTIAPNFSSQDHLGNNFNLSSAKGKYILIDFWASWCPPCRQESPTLVRIYNTFKDKNFTIVSVSVDDKRDKWLDAIEKDGLLWTNVSDVNGWKSSVATLYNVSAIPQSFLIDKEGKIVAKNLRGSDLENKLMELISK